jgi:hypothetical protein
MSTSQILAGEKSICEAKGIENYTFDLQSIFAGGIFADFD